MEKRTVDLLIIGGGLAAMMAALEAGTHPLSILVASKRKVGKSGATLMAGSNFAAVLPEGEEKGDRFSFHIEDTLLGGAGINDPRLVKTLVENAPADLLHLEELGIRFIKSEGKFDLRKPPGHGNPRTVFTFNPGFPMKIRGKSITGPLQEAVREAGVPLLEGVRVIRLILKDGRIAGALALREKTGERIFIQCRAAILACGGGGAVYEINTNPGDLTGDAYSLVLQAGGSLRDMEFVQFYPCMSLEPPHPPIYSPILSDGGILRNKDGERFLARYQPERMEMATRDAVSQAIYREIQEGRGIDGGVYLDLTSIPRDLFSFRFPDLLRLFAGRGIDLHREWIRVAPSAHFFMGGAVIDERCRTTIPGLFAAGEAAGGVHGANRLSGNGLSEPLVFGRIAGREAAEYALEHGRASLLEEAFFDEPEGRGNRLTEETLARVRARIKRLLWEKAGIIRGRVPLSESLEEMRSLQDILSQARPATPAGLSLYWDVHSMLLTGRAIVHAALGREESRGAHFREDFPQSRTGWEKSSFLRLQEGEMHLSGSAGRGDKSGGKG